MNTDPIADFLTRIRNAQKAKHYTFDVYSSKMKLQLAEILKKEGFISDYRQMTDQGKKMIRVHLRYLVSGEPILHELKRISKPGCRIYVSKDDIPHSLASVAVTVVSTSKGVMTGREAMERNLGGELICSVM